MCQEKNIGGNVDIYYYFTEAKYAIDNIKNKYVKVSALSELNDLNEIKNYKIKNKAERDSLDRFLSEKLSKYGILCLTSEWSNPVHWAHYGGRNKGIAMGFEVDKSNLFKVSYCQEKLNIPRKNGIPYFTEEDLEKLLSLKFIHWQYEQEFRLFIVLEETRFVEPNYFEKFSPALKLQELILGARYEENINELKEELNKLDSSVKIYKAKPSDGKFEFDRDEIW